jgi:hypothetical protein
MADQVHTALMPTPLPTPADDTADTLIALARRREDPDPEVRRDVAETLESLARTRPTVVLATVQRWLAEGGPHTQTVVRPALHVLSRNGDDGARRLLGFAPEVAVRVRDVVIESDHVRTGEALRIRARVVSAETRRVAVSIDAAVDDLRPIIVNTRRLDPPRDPRPPPAAPAAFRRGAARAAHAVDTRQRTTRRRGRLHGRDVTVGGG